MSFKLNKKDIKSNIGITLIALVITIIVLLILAGVTIVTLTGDNGILTKAGDVKNISTNAEIEEKMKLAYQDYKMAKYSESGYTLQNALAKTGLDIVSVEGNDSVGYEVKVNTKDGEKLYVLLVDGTVGKASTEWKNNGDGSYTKGIRTIHVGDIVHYETELDKIANAELTTLRTDLSTYSGNSSSTYNSNIDRESLTWKVLDIKDGKIRLISAEPTSKSIELENYNGYNNAVYLIDKACDKLYSIDGVGKAQNLKIEDIEEKIDKTKFDYTQYENKYVDTGKYGGTIEYTSGILLYPNIYPSEIGCKGIDGTSGTDNNTGILGLSEQTSPVIGNSNAKIRIKATQTAWFKKSMKSTDFIDSKYYNLFLNNGSILPTYWLSSRCVNITGSNTDFRVYVASSGSNGIQSVGASTLCCSYSASPSYFHTVHNRLRPVITLESNIQLSGDSTNTWTIQ